LVSRWIAGAPAKEIPKPTGDQVEIAGSDVEQLDSN
jgi:hypothetical protein